jgi:hypothetical protein
MYFNYNIIYYIVWFKYIFDFFVTLIFFEQDEWLKLV